MARRPGTILPRPGLVENDQRNPRLRRASVVRVVTWSPTTIRVSTFPYSSYHPAQTKAEIDELEDSEPEAEAPAPKGKSGKGGNAKAGKGKGAAAKVGAKAKERGVSVGGTSKTIPKAKQKAQPRAVGTPRSSVPTVVPPPRKTQTASQPSISNRPKRANAGKRLQQVEVVEIPSTAESASDAEVASDAPSSPEVKRPGMWVEGAGTRLTVRFRAACSAHSEVTRRLGWGEDPVHSFVAPVRCMYQSACSIHELSPLSPSYFLS